MGLTKASTPASPGSDISRLRRLALSFSARARQRRAELFRQSFKIDESTRILDLGYGSRANISLVLAGTEATPRNVYIADISETNIRKGSERYGYVPVLVDESAPLPFPDGFFDIVYCSSVIEHVTVPKAEVWKTYSGRKFREKSQVRQQAFAREIARVGKQYFVQCPYRHFPVESHSLMPFFNWLPRWLLIPALKVTNTFWIKRSTPDWNLLNKRQLKSLFPGSRILEERGVGLTKSIMAVRSSSDEELTE